MSRIQALGTNELAAELRQLVDRNVAARRRVGQLNGKGPLEAWREIQAIAQDAARRASATLKEQNRIDVRG
jgi:hypothetical protein